MQSSKFHFHEAYPTGATDSTTCKAIGARQGVGKIKHLETKSLWLQQHVKSKTVYIRKTGTKDNLADLGTKIFQPGEFERLRSLNGYHRCTVIDAFPEKKVIKTISGVSAHYERGGADYHTIDSCIRTLVTAIVAASSQEKR